MSNNEIDNFLDGVSKEENQKEELITTLSDVLAKIWNDAQNRPDQYIISYHRIDNDKFIGYHASSFCQITSDPLEA